MLGVESCSGLEQLSQWYRSQSGQVLVDPPAYLRTSTAFSSVNNLVPQQDFAKLEKIRATYGVDVYVAVLAALMAGDAVKGTTSPNPPVGACILGWQEESGEGATEVRAFIGGTQSPGSAHAEVMALNAAGDHAQGGTAVVTLEPCNHTGRTGPCADALVQAGVARVFFMASDPNPQASGGADYLRDHGVEVIHLPITPLALAPWLRSIREHRPAITAKWAHTLDGFIAAVDGSSKWITGAKAREFVHYDRSRRDAIVVGTGTALADNPQLTARRSAGSSGGSSAGLYPRQPIRVVIGSRALPADSVLARDLVAPSQLDLGSGAVVQFATVEEALEVLWDVGARDVIVEGGSGLFASLFSRGVVDFIHDYTAPALLGDGIPLLASPLAHSMDEILRFSPLAMDQLGADVLWQLAREK